MKSTIKKTRKFYIDWLRIALILSVFLFHIGMFFNHWGWHVKNDIQLRWLSPVMEFLHYWRMPLLFLVSGVGTYYALGHRTVKQYLKERSIRILLPFLICFSHAATLFLIAKLIIDSYVKHDVYLCTYLEYYSLFFFFLFLPERKTIYNNLSHLWR